MSTGNPFEVIKGGGEVTKLPSDEDTRADILDCLQGWQDQGKVQTLVVLVEDVDNNLYLWTDCETNAEIIGLMEICKANYIHNAQHQ